MSFARLLKNWTENNWKHVLWSSESKFEILGSNLHQYLLIRSGESTIVSVCKHVKPWWLCHGLVLLR